MRPFGDAPDDARQGMLCFGAACEISVDCSEGIDSLIASRHTVLCVRGKVTDRNAETEYRQNELCTISAEGGLTLFGRGMEKSVFCKAAPAHCGLFAMMRPAAAGSSR